MNTEEMKGRSAQEIMKAEVISVSPDESVQAVAQLLMDHGIHGVPVVDAGRKVIGIVTESDFFVKDKVFLHIPSFMDIMQKTMVARALRDADRSMLERIVSARVRDIMTSECVTVYAGTSFHDLLAMFGTTHFKTIPVVDEGRHLIGVVTVTDMLTALTRPLTHAVST